MQVSQFPCPECGVSLRTKGKVHIGKTLPCPDCDMLIEVIINEEGQVSANIVESGHVPIGDKTRAVTRDSGSESLNETDKQDSHARNAQQVAIQAFQKTARIIGTPVGIAWSVAGVALFCLMLAIWLDGNPASNDLSQNNTITADNHEPPENVPAEPKQASDTNLQPEKTPTVGGDQSSDSNQALTILDQPIMPDFSEELITEIEPDISENTKLPTVSPEVTLGDPDKKDLPPVKAPLPQKNVQRALQQSIRAFHQSRSIALREMLLQLQELAGVVIVIQLDKEDERLSSKVKIMLDNTTIAKILTAVLEPVGLIYKIQDGEIHVTSG